MSADATRAARAGWPWCGVLACLCAAARLSYAFAAQRQFPHINGWSDGSGVAADTLGMAAVMLAGLVLGARGLRGPGLVGRTLAVIALALLAPFAADAALTPLSGATDSAAARSITFLVLTEALIAASLVAAARAAARERLAARTSEPPAPARASRRARSPHWSVKLAVMCGSIAITLLLGEWAFRALDLRPYSNPVLIIPGAERRILLSEIALFRPSARPPDQDGLAARFRPYLYLKGWYDRPQWPYFDKQGCVDYVFNRWGLRDHDFELAKQPGEYRIVAIGDSFTFGVGAQLDDCWTEVLERTLKERLHQPVEVINAGFASGHHPGMYEPWIAKDGVRLAPDVLIVGLCLNDMHPGVEMYAYDVATPPRVLGGESVLASFLALQMEQWRHPAHHLLDFTDRVIREPAQWQTVQAALRASHDVLAAHGIRLLVVPFPMLSGLREAEYPYAKLLAMARDFCAGAGIECVDLLPDFLGQQDELLWAHPTDQHPNDRGHALIAAGIARYLAQHGG